MSTSFCTNSEMDAQLNTPPAAVVPVLLPRNAIPPGGVRRNIMPAGLVTPDQPIRVADTRQALAPLRENVVAHPRPQIPGGDLHARTWFAAWLEAENVDPN